MIHLNIALLNQCLGELRPEVSPACCEAEFSKVRLYDPDLPADPDTLVLGTQAQFLGNRRPEVMGLLGEVQLRFPGQDVSGILERIRQALARYDTWLAECIGLVHPANSLQSLVDAVEQAFSIPLLILNSALDVVAWAGALDSVLSLETWDSIRETGCLPDSTRNTFYLEHKESLFQSSPFQIPAGLFPVAVLCIHIFSRSGERLGTAVLFLDETQPWDGQEFLMKQAVSLMLQRTDLDEEHRKALHLTSRLADALENPDICLSALDRELSLLGWQTNARKRILILCSQEQDVDPASLQELTGQDGNVYPVFYHGQLILLYHDDLQQLEQKRLDLQLEQAEKKKARELKEQASMQHWKNLYKFRNRLDQFLQAHQCAAFYSYPFRETKLLDQYYKQTVSLLSLMPQLPGTRNCCLDALSYLGYQGCPVFYESLLHPILPFLKQYDHAHGTDYYLTLCDIVCNGGNKSKAAEAPGIEGNHMHRNTAKHRLDKIKELVPLELDDPQQTKALMFSFYFDNRFSTYPDSSTAPIPNFNMSEEVKKAAR